DRWQRIRGRIRRPWRRRIAERMRREEPGGEELPRLSSQTRKKKTSTCGLLFPPACGVHPPGHRDADHIEAQHGEGIDAHRPRIGAGADDSGHNEDRQDGVADVFKEEAWADDAEEGQEKDEDGQLKADAKTEDDGKKEPGVLLDGHDGVELVAETENENLERAGQNEEVPERRSGEEQADGGGHEGNDEALLFLVKARRDEQPYLVEDEGCGDNGAADERNLHVEVERVHGVGVIELDAELGKRSLDEAVKPLAEIKGDEKPDGEIDGGVNDALAELVEMLHEAHAGQFGALGDRLAGFFDSFLRINHGGRPAPIVRLQGWCSPGRLRRLLAGARWPIRRKARRVRLAAGPGPADWRRRLHPSMVAECADGLPRRPTPSSRQYARLRLQLASPLLRVVGPRRQPRWIPQAGWPWRPDREKSFRRDKGCRRVFPASRGRNPRRPRLAARVARVEWPRPALFAAPPLLSCGGRPPQPGVTPLPSGI